MRRAGSNAPDNGAGPVGHAGIIFTPRRMADMYDALSCALRPGMSFARSVSPVRTFGDLALPVPGSGASGLLTSPFADRVESPV